MRFLINSLSIDYQKGDREKRPFLFLHGNTQNDTCGKGVKDFFQQKGHPIYSYDLPGHGNSQLDTTDYLFEDLIDLNHQIMEHLNLSNPILCGHSLGGIIHSGTIAKNRRTDASLILCGSYDGNPILDSIQQDNDQSEIAKMLEEYVEEGKQLFQKQWKYDYFSNRHVPDEELNIINRQYTHPAANEANLSSLGDFSARETLVKMEIPILVLHGAEETVIPKSLVQKMAEAYSNINLCWYEDMGHYAFYQAPLKTNQFLERYYHFL